MKRKINSLLRSEQGNIMVVFAFSMVFFLGLVGLVVDMGLVYKEKSDLKKAATTAVLSGAQELTNGDAARVQAVVNKVLASYQAQSSLNSLQTDLNQQVKVILKKQVPLRFAKIFGLNSMTVQAQSTAKVFPISGLYGATPLGIPESTPITYGQTVALKVGAGDANTGSFGILALEGKGASTYEETLKVGAKLQVSVGDIIGVQTGNISGATQNAVNYRISQCPNPSGDWTIRECARIITVIVYKTYSSSQIKVTGFAYFYIQQQMSNTDTTIMGTFIKRVDTGTYGPGSLDRGAYMARLTE
ncbi:TadE/TadG family type IV pilus assembly protein [Neobacillus vireti]|uniref:TadE/TadG family type IV pilus assembly protein n=1 Tax=Neobacillus vireti TaxID=220686 RepID=UPI002FFF7FAC